MASRDCATALPEAINTASWPGHRLPAVAMFTCRVVNAPLALQPDNIEIAYLLQCGMIIFHAENQQDLFDFIMKAFIISEKNEIRDILIKKYENDTISNIVQFRKIAKIARAEYVDADKKAAKSVLEKLFQLNDFSIEAAYQESVSGAYSERDLLSRIKGLLERIELVHINEMDDEVRQYLRELIDRASRLLNIQ